MMKVQFNRIDWNDRTNPELPGAFFESPDCETSIDGVHIATMLDGRIAIQGELTQDVYLCHPDYVAFDDEYSEGNIYGTRYADGSIVAYDYDRQVWIDTRMDAERDDTLPEGSAGNPLPALP